MFIELDSPYTKNKCCVNTKNIIRFYPRFCEGEQLVEMILVDGSVAHTTTTYEHLVGLLRNGEIE